MGCCACSVLLEGGGDGQVCVRAPLRCSSTLQGTHLSPAGEYNLRLGVMKELRPDLIATHQGTLLRGPGSQGVEAKGPGCWARACASGCVRLRGVRRVAAAVSLLVTAGVDDGGSGGGCVCGARAGDVRVFEGHAFIVEAAVSIGGRDVKPGINVFRFANRIPLLFEAREGAC